MDNIVDLFTLLVPNFAKHVGVRYQTAKRLASSSCAWPSLSGGNGFARIRAVKSGKKKPRYVLGIDFGTLSGRALLVNAHTGQEVAWADHPYKNGVIEETLPGRKKRLKPLTSLQDPADYIEVLKKAVPRVMGLAKAKPEQVLGIGVDFTSCTMLPTLADGTPLSSLNKWRNNPHAWVKLWKHHAAQPEANRINEIGSRQKEDFITAYGGKYSSEWFFAKLLETVREAPKVYEAADRFVE